MEEYIPDLLRMEDLPALPDPEELGDEALLALRERLNDLYAEVDAEEPAPEEEEEDGGAYDEWLEQLEILDDWIDDVEEAIDKRRKTWP